MYSKNSILSSHQLECALLIFFCQLKAKTSNQGACVGWNKSSWPYTNMHLRRHNGCTLIYVEILRTALLPFLSEKFATGHRFMQDNDPKHTSWIAKGFFEENNVNWWKTAPESPDLNPVENMWHELKEFIRCQIKPQNKQELIDGIQTLLEDGGCCKVCKVAYTCVHMYNSIDTYLIGSL